MQRETIKSLAPKRLGLMDRLRGAIKAAGKGFTFPAYGSYPIYGYNSPSDWPYNPLPGTVEDWESQAGNFWQNNAVGICLNWYMDAVQAAPPIIRKRGTNDKKDIVDHPLTSLLRRPNPYYSGSRLWAGTILDYKTGGNGYWFNVRDGAGRITELWYRPRRMVRPRWDNDGGDYLTGYLYFVNGKNVPMKSEDVVHFPFGIDPLNERMGLKTLGMVTREIVQANEASTYGSAILRNGGVPGMIVSPASADASFGDSGNQDAVKQKIEAVSSRENRGRVVVLDGTVKVDVPGFSPQALALESLLTVPCEFICAAMGLPAMAVGLPSKDRTYSNWEEANEAAWDRYQSMNLAFAEVLNTAFDGETIQIAGKSQVFDADKLEVGWDYSLVPALQPDVDALHLRVRADFQARLIDRYEAKTLLGQEPAEEDKGVYYTSPMGGPDPNERTTDAQDTNGGSAGQLDGIPAIPGGNGKQPVTRGTG